MHLGATPLHQVDARILFIEDSLDDADLTRWHLSKAGIAFTSAIVGTAEELMAYLNQGCPDLIISDMIIPGFDGWAAFRISQAMAPQAPFIFHSGSIEEDRCRKALALGAFGCVEKDRVGTLVVELVERALGIRAGEGIRSQAASPRSAATG